MVRVSPPSVSASSGELSELLWGRRDFARYANGLRLCRGFIPLPEGPVTRLPGTRFMGFTRADMPGRLMAFIFRDEDAVLLEWTDSALRFWRQGAPVLLSGSPYQIATPYPAARLSNLQSLQSSDRIYLVDGTLAPQRLSRTALTAWTIDATPFKGGPFADRNTDEAKEMKVSGVVGTITISTTFPFFAAYHVGTLLSLEETNTAKTPYWIADKKVSVGDQLLYGGNVYRVAGFNDLNGTTGGTQPVVSAGPPKSIAIDNNVAWRYVADGNGGGAANWAAAATVTIGTRRYFPIGNVTGEVDGFTAGTGGRQNTGTNPPVHTSGTWLSDPDGVIWKFLHDGRGFVRITAITNSQLATGVVEKRIPDGLIAAYTYRWAEAAWSDQRGWPRAVGGYEQRHVYGGTPTDPRVLWMGVIGGTVDMTTGKNDDDGFSYALKAPARQVGEILSITDAGLGLHICTAADQVIGRSTDGDRAFARETARFDSVSAEGAKAGAEPVIADGNPAFIGKGGSRLYAMQADASGRPRAENLTQIARHILGPGAVRIVRQERPIEIIWALLTDGTLAGCTFVPSQQAVGFHAHDLGGFIEDIEVMPADDGISQDLWLIVRRTLGGVTRRCVERMEQPFIDLDGEAPALPDAWHQMCGARWTGAETDVIPGFLHLAGETVTAWTDRGAFTDLVVDIDGTVTLPEEVTSAIVGLDVTGLQAVETLDIVAGQPDGGDDGRMRAHRETGVRVSRSAGGTMEVKGARDGVPVLVAPKKPLFKPIYEGVPILHDGPVEVAGMKGWTHQAWLKFEPEPGAPLTILSRTPTMMIGDD